VNLVSADRRKSGLPQTVTAAIRAADDRKAQDIVALDLRGLTDATDFFVVASATSDAHVRGVANGILEKLESIGVPAHHVEGVQAGRWALLDFVDFVVHIFHPESRAFYQLERLWNDAPRFAYPLAPERKA
jgi:ribosome-associated protein